jgi:hypothetical protein
MGVLVHPIPTTPGLVSGWIGLDQPIGISVGTSTVTRLFLKRTDEAGTVTAEIRNAGGDTLSVSMATGTDSAAATGSIDFADAEPILLRVTAADVGSMNLGGSIEVESPQTATGFLTTLARVKNFLNVTDTSQYSIINDLLPGVSLALTGLLRRAIVQDSVTAEIHEVRSERIYKLALDEWPVITLSAVRENGTTLTSAEYRDLGDGLIERTSTGTPTARRPYSQGYVEFDYTYGYTSIPEDLVAVATAEVALAWEQTRHGGARLGKSGGSFPGQSDAQYFTAWQPLPYTQAVLASHRRVA